MTTTIRNTTLIIIAFNGKTQTSIVGHLTGETRVLIFLIIVVNHWDMSIHCMAITVRVGILHLLRPYREVI